MACEGKEVVVRSGHRQATRPPRSVATGRRGLDSRERFACRDGWHVPRPFERVGTSRRRFELRWAAFVR